jgi:putative zinc finger/helix-turn-helix YgiT family protein
MMTNQETPITCLQCGEKQLAPGEVNLAGTRYGESFTVKLDGFRCTACGFETVDSSQSVKFSQLLSDSYRRTNGLLTGIEIKDIRSQLDMSQQAFADYLGVGVASVKRWEMGHIQERAMDALIRLKTDPEVARRNLDVLKRQVPERHILSALDDMELTFTLGQRDCFGDRLQIQLDSSFCAQEEVEFNDPCQLAA